MILFAQTIDKIAAFQRIVVVGDAFEQLFEGFVLGGGVYFIYGF